MERKNEDKNQKKIRSVKVKQEDEEIYVRYYVGHKGKFGHEFLEFEFRPDGRLRYANNSNYKQDILIRKQVTVSKLVLNQVKKIIVDSGILNIDDNQWPIADKTGQQELEIQINDQYINLNTCKIGSFADVLDSKDPKGMTIFYYLVQDLKCLTFSLIGLHFRIKPVH